MEHGILSAALRLKFTIRSRSADIAKSSRRKNPADVPLPEIGMSFARRRPGSVGCWTGVVCGASNRVVKRLLSLCDNWRVSQIITRQWVQTLIQPANERYSGGDFQLGDIRIRNSIKIFDQCAQRIAVSSDNRSAASTDGRRQSFVPIW